MNINKINLSNKEVLTMAFPTMLEMLFTTMTSIIDSKMVSILGTKAISAIAVTNQPRLFIFSIFFAINTVISTLVATYLGKKDRVKANSFFITSIKLIVVGSIVFGLLSILFARTILEICSGQKDTMEMSITYFRIIMGGMIFNHLYMGINAVLRGCGNTKVTFTSSVVSCVINIFLNYCLIGGNLNFPALGIKGAAISTVVGTIFASIFCLMYLYKANTFISIKFCIKNKIKSTKSIFKEFYEMWKHVLRENLLTRGGMLIISSFNARAGSDAMAIYTIGNYLLNIIYAVGSGLQTASVALIGRSNGEGRKDLIKEYQKTILRLGLIISVLLSILFIVFAKPYFKLFSNDPEFIQIGTYVCMIIAIIAPIQTAKIIYTGCLQGLGKMKETMISSLIAVTIAQPVFCYIFIILLKLGVWGVWIPIFASQLIGLIMSYSFYRKAEINLGII